jgi:4-amino-4-deoxy-L-arabinose transferase-like glycosyltransferase
VILALTAYGTAGPTRAQGDLRAGRAPLRTDGRVPALALFALALGTALYLSRLDGTPIQSGNEAMYTFPPLRMLQTGDYLVPYYEHGPFLEKPPLTWWILAGSYKLFGSTIFAARLPGAIAAPLTILVVAVWARRRAGPSAGLLTALVLMYSFKFAAFARQFAADTFLTLAVTLAVAALDLAARDATLPDRRAGVLAGLSLALAFGFKGLIGIVLPLGGVAAGLLLDRTQPERWKSRAAIAATTFLLAIAPWHLAMSLRFGAAFWEQFYWRNHLLRGATATYTHHPPGLFYYFGVLALVAFPWIVLLPSAIRDRCSRRSNSSAPLGWLVFGFVFLSLLRMKREVYLMPILPAFALLIGEGLGSDETSGRRNRWAWAIAGVTSAGAVFLWIRMAPTLTSLAGGNAHAVLGVGLVALSASLLAAATTIRVRAGPILISVACGVLFIAILIVESRISRFDPVPHWGRRVRRECGDGCEGLLLKLDFRSLAFYTRFEWEAIGDVREISDRRPKGKSFLVLRSRDEEKLRALPFGYRVLDRRPWLEQNWILASLHPDLYPLQSLSLVALEPSSETSGRPPAADTARGRRSRLFPEAYDSIGLRQHM